jgi:hypothetical protein
VRVAVRGLHFEDAVADFENADVKRATTEVIHGDLFVLLLVEAVSERRGGRLVDDAEHFEPRDLAGVLRGLALRVIEISGNRDDGLRDLLAELRFRISLELRENHRADLRRAVGLRLPAGLHLDVRVAVRSLHHFVRHALQFVLHFVKFASHETLHREDRVRRVRHRLPLRSLADDAFAGLRERDDAGRRARAFGVFEHYRLTAIHDGHAGVGRAKIDTKNFSHKIM